MNVGKLIVIFSIGLLTQCSVILADCENQICKLGYEFCETGKQVCRQCSDFKDFCWVDNKHISNCSSYCNKETLSPTSCKESSFIWLYPTLIGLAVFSAVAIVCSCLIYQNLKLRRKMKMDDSRSSTEIDASSEEETDLLKKSHEDLTVVRLQEIHVDNDIGLHSRADLYGFVPPILTATAGCQETGDMAISGR
ncbi:uncharacterized protein LOC134727023 [Mytilus trossulus]|uniref:uncharacterized protein LOC134727023 n=1 Tax=Mytilus trossulus TaxID=6551 RepID=UPI003004A155